MHPGRPRQTEHEFAVSSAQRRILGKGEMADRVRSHPWDTTPLGPIESWSKELLTVVNLALSSPAPARLMWGPEFILIYNDAYMQIPGPRHPAALGRAAREVYSESWPVVGPLLEKAIETGETLFYERLLIPLPTEDGMQDHYLNYSFNPVFEDGRIVGLFGSLHDVTGEVLATRRLRESEARASRIMQSIGDAVIVTDAESCITRMNPVAESMTGWSVREAVGLPLSAVFRILSEETRDAVESPADRVRRLGVPVGLANHTLLIRRDGIELCIDDSAAPIHEDDGRLSGIVLIFRDVGEKRRQERERDALLAEVRHRYAELEATYNNAAIAMALIDAKEFRYLRVNKKLCEILGLPEAQVIGSRVLEVAAGVPGLEEALRKVAAGETVAGGIVEGELSTSPGIKRFWTLDYTPVHSATGEVVAIAAASAEITLQKRAEALLIQNEKLAAVGRLASSIAHEINNPLESITNLLYLLREEELAPKAKEYVETAERELRRVSAIATQTLSFNRQATSPQAVTCEALIGEVLRIYQGRLVNSRIKVERRERAERPFLCFDGELRQVISNLISNAIDAMSPAGGRLLLRSRDGRDSRTGKEALVITVADTGPGMSADTAKRVFQPFFTTKSLSGTGLGLWISREILARHGGSISLRTSQRAGASGTVLTVSLPRVRT